jgi:hypothetical protein
MSSLVVDSRGLWLMPEFCPRTNSIACGITSCSFIASWPAPLGMRYSWTPRACTARSQRACQAGALGAAAARIVSSIEWRTPRRSQISLSLASTSITIASRCGSVGARKSSVKTQRPGMTLVEPFGTSRMPMVPTESPSRVARCSTNNASSATATAASRRLFIGVVPAWLAMPVTSHR